MTEVISSINKFNYITCCGKEFQFNNEKTLYLCKKLHNKSCPQCKSICDIQTNILLTINDETASRKSNKKLKKLSIETRFDNI